MALETYLIIEYEQMSDDGVEKIGALLKKELGADVYVGDTGFDTDRIWAGDDSSGIGHFSEVEKLLAKMDEIIPNFKCHGEWQVTFTVVDGAPDSWSFDWSESKVLNVVDELAAMQQTVISKWDKACQRSELLKPEMFEHWIYEEVLYPRRALEEIEEMLEDGSWDSDDPFDDKGTVTYGDVAHELNRILYDE